MRILLLDTKANNPNRYIANAVFRALKRHPTVHEVAWATYAGALTAAQRTTFDAFLAFDGEEADNPIVERLCQIVPRRAIWFTEDPYAIHRNIEVARHFDVVFTNDRRSTSCYEAPTYHLPLAADIDMHYCKILDQPRPYDIFFAGTAWPNRIEFIDKLRKERPHLRYKFILVTNPVIERYLTKYNQVMEFSSGISVRDFCRLANRSALTLTLPREFSSDPTRLKATSDTPGPRLFEVALAGGCQLVDARTMPTARELFIPGKEILTYDSADECLELIDRAISAPEHSIPISSQAQRACTDRHLYDHRVDLILHHLLSAPGLDRRPPRRPRPRILFIAHNVIPSPHFGGAEIYLDEARKNLFGYDCYVLVRIANGYSLIGPQENVIETIIMQTEYKFGDFTNAEFEQRLQELMAHYAFDIVHINHLMKFPLSLLPVASAMGAKLFFHCMIIFLFVKTLI